jgi:hypothetical protein
MTFTEAALEVLRAAGEPLHYKKITELAIERNLLSHVGKSPEITMISRLATLVKSDRGEGPIVKVKPGVFAARAAGARLLSAASAGDDEGAADAGQPTGSAVEVPGADVFPAEADDDEPILAGLDEGAPNGAAVGSEGEGQDGGGGRRRRRRRRGRGGGGRGMELQGSAGQGGGQQGAPRHEGHGDRDRDRDRDRGPRREFPPRDGRGFGGGGGGGGRREPDVDLSRAPGEGDLLGKDLADAAFAVLSQAERAPASFARVADLLVRRGRLSGDPLQLAPTVAAALRADVALANKARVRSRFRLRGGEVALSNWRLPREAARFEDDAERAAERQRIEIRRAFVARLNELPAAGFAELLASWLNAEGVTSLRAVRRPGGSGQAFHFAGILRRGAEELRLAIVVQRAGRDVDREAIVEVRGSLAHYGNAIAAWLVSTGRVTSGAREELAVEGGPPCAAFDGHGLAAAMERFGIGLRQHQVVLSDIDFDLLEALGDASDRRDRDRMRPSNLPAIAAGESGEGAASGTSETDLGEAADAPEAENVAGNEDDTDETAEFVSPEGEWEDEDEGAGEAEIGIDDDGNGDEDEPAEASGTTSDDETSRG